MRAGSSRVSRLTLRWLAASDAPAPDRPVPRLRANALGVRTMVNFGGGIKGMEGYLKQEKLREKVEQMQDARAKAERYASEREINSDGSSERKKRDAAHPRRGRLLRPRWVCTQWPRRRSNARCAPAPSMT